MNVSTLPKKKKFKKFFFYDKIAFLGPTIGAVVTMGVLAGISVLLLIVLVCSIHWWKHREIKRQSNNSGMVVE